MNYKTISKCRGRGRKEILKRLQYVVARHTKRVFQANEYHTDNEFKEIEAYLVSFAIQK